MRDFFKTSLAFMAGLIAVLAITEGFLQWRIAELHGKTCVSPEIYLAIERARARSDEVRSVYLGDSVAHQLFAPGSESSGDQRFLTSNQAGSLAAQYYILEDAVRSFPNLKEVYLLYYPRSFENDLGPPFANDYFCGFFHSPRQMREVFGVKRDAHLLLVQIGRFILPNIMATNSLNRPLAWEMGEQPQPVTSGTGGSGSEPLVTLLNWLWSVEPVEQPPSPTLAERPVFLSRVSRVYLEKMRRLCQSHGLALHMLPCPCSEVRRFTGVLDVYDARIIYRPASQFGDGIHVKEAYRAGLREEMKALYRLPS